MTEKKCQREECPVTFTPDNPARLYCCDECRSRNRGQIKQTASDEPDKVRAMQLARRNRFADVMRKHGLM